MPHQTVATHRHIVVLSKTNQLIGTAIGELSLTGLQGIHLHFVLCHHHTELLTSLITVTLITLVSAQCYTNSLVALVCIVA